ncbi:diaminobutyrate acetyltransferase [Shouchella lonarensis]|uniref:L-2,4-diaminobutyric acid acetyltransferase n=1 Tax=Shouchella lonarensis TaxID=1464122 RepID=A0A1G6GHB4_9BACI|nr:diaminobutyrate acetyltransferase [Shouchella lonarensis]SDB81422.1 diaminobutyrate acetyltransferase [Shouchella lonarensis]
MNPSLTPVLTITRPTVEEAASMWELVQQSTLDKNSAYKYVMMCTYFAETCVVAKENDHVVGFITGFIPPEKRDVVFVWQIGVASSQRGKGVGSKMLHALIEHEACKDVNYVEATVTPSNKASQALFRRLARDYMTNCFIGTGFKSSLFPEDGHEEERCFRIGPLK